MHSKTDPQSAWQTALRMLDIRPYARAELCAKLTDRGFSPQAVEETALRLTELRLLDDAAFAAALARRCTYKGWGPRRLREELSRRGVPPELWEEALQSLEDPASTIDHYLATRLRGDPTDPKVRRRGADALARRGFSLGDISAGFARLTRNLDQN